MDIVLNGTVAQCDEFIELLEHSLKRETDVLGLAKCSSEILGCLNALDDIMVCDCGILFFIPPSCGREGAR